jgi:1,4-alpha-glucan branching enzyme
MKKKYMFQLVMLIVAAGALFGCACHYFDNDDNTVRFYLRAPKARHVELIASFNGFAPMHAQRAGCGAWMVEVPNTHSFAYFYLIDGQVRVPDCDVREQDDFGRFNCLFQHIQ